MSAYLDPRELGTDLMVLLALMELAEWGENWAESSPACRPVLSCCPVRWSLDVIVARRDLV